MDSSDLYIVFSSNLFEFFHSFPKLWKGNVYRSSKSRSKVSWAGSDVSEIIILSKLSNLLNLGSSN